MIHFQFLQFFKSLYGCVEKKFCQDYSFLLTVKVLTGGFFLFVFVKISFQKNMFCNTSCTVNTRCVNNVTWLDNIQFTVCTWRLVCTEKLNLTLTLELKEILSWQKK